MKMELSEYILYCLHFSAIANVINMFRFRDAIEARSYSAILPYPSGKRQNRQVGSNESDHIDDNPYSL